MVTCEPRSRRQRLDHLPTNHHLALHFVTKQLQQGVDNMDIGIIGAGHIGGTLTRRLTAVGHRVFVANSRGPETLIGLAHETGAEPVTIHEAARSGDIVIVTIPEKAIAELPRDLFAGVPDDVIVIDTGNYYPQRIALPVAGDDPRAKQKVIDLLDELGFDGVDAGTIDESWRQQPGTPVYATDHDVAGVKKALSEASNERKPEWKAAQAGASGG